MSTVASILAIITPFALFCAHRCWQRGEACVASLYGIAALAMAIACTAGFAASVGALLIWWSA